MAIQARACLLDMGYIMSFQLVFSTTIPFGFFFLYIRDICRLIRFKLGMMIGISLLLNFSF